MFIINTWGIKKEYSLVFCQPDSQKVKNNVLNSLRMHICMYVAPKVFCSCLCKERHISELWMYLWLISKLLHCSYLGLFCSMARYIFCLLEDGIYRANLPLFLETASAASLVVRSHALRDFMINFQSKRLIFFNKTEQAFVSGFLDGSEFHTLRSHVPLDDMESFVYEDNIFTVTDGRAVFHEEISQVESSSFNEYVVDCSLEYPEYFGFGNLLFYAASTQPFPLPTLPRLVTVLFGLHQAVISWSPPEHPIGTSEFSCYFLEVQSFSFQRKTGFPVLNVGL